MADPSLRLRLRVPPPAKKPRGRPVGRVAKYDADIIRLNNQRYLPSRIAEMLCREHDLDPAVMNRKSVERRLRTIKTKGLAKLAPLNEDADIVARDAPKKCKKNKFFYLSLRLS
jgi:hypothetical protein